MIEQTLHQGKTKHLKNLSVTFCSDIGMCLFFNDPSIDKKDAMTDE